jgi:hypothetical protein
MLNIKNFNSAKIFHNELLFCWLSTKINGRKGRTYPKGHSCGKNSCPVCSIQTKIDNSLPAGFKSFMNKKKNLEILISGEPNDLRLLNFRFRKLTLTVQEREAVALFFVSATYTTWFQPNFGLTFFQKLNINTCIYCNRNYSMSISNQANEKVLIPTFDHWFPKEEYPILAISFYNLIPSCHPCNSSIKGSAKNVKWDKALNNMTHPYKIDPKEKFSFSYINKLSNEYNVNITVDNKSKISNTLRLFKINDVYNSHSDLELRDLLDLRYKYPKNYIDMLVNTTFKGIMDSDEIYRLIFGIEIKEDLYHKRPLNKFKHDIIKKLLESKS